MRGLAQVGYVVFSLAISTSASAQATANNDDSELDSLSPVDQIAHSYLVQERAKTAAETNELAEMAALLPDSPCAKAATTPEDASDVSSSSIAIQVFQRYGCGAAAAGFGVKLFRLRNAAVAGDFDIKDASKTLREYGFDAARSESMAARANRLLKVRGVRAAAVLSFAYGLYLILRKPTVERPQYTETESRALLKYAVVVELCRGSLIKCTDDSAANELAATKLVAATHGETSNRCLGPRIECLP